ncbi:MAG: glycerol-3-phosphate 1-O-acyltransferase PlsY [Clostridiales bacterium]|nr:glycerol-3-phosphate 1-O-acyltransferase PlsY [Clostridiales bacterium]HBM81760.1 acyl-phosphate glycerol 3-phosphate acyltransferase [Clostridiaceae bacterium]
MYTLNIILNIGCILILSYLAGSFPTSIIVAKVLKGIDIRKFGSGNAGATNTFRVLGWKAGLAVACIDVFKGFAATFWISKISFFGTPLNFDMLVQVLAGSAAVLGHCYTVFADFKGGKGVAASAGMLIALFPAAFFICFGVFTIVLLSSGYVSLSSLVAAFALPVTLFVLRLVFVKHVSISLLIFSVAIFAFIFYSHRNNIKRLILGKENRFKSLKIFSKNIIG